MHCPLSPKERSTLYSFLGELGAYCHGDKQLNTFSSLSGSEILALACEESRFDPRLLGVLIDYFSKHYQTLNPFELARAIQKIPTPQTLGVVSEFAKKVCKDLSLKAFFQIAMGNLKPIAFQSFYNNQYRPRVITLLQENLYTPKEFRIWGFYSAMDPYLKEFRPKKFPWTFKKSDRKRILKAILKEKKMIRMKDYMQALRGAVSRQQAYLDLKKEKSLRKIGTNRGRRYKR
jgi:hypothetical protein